MKKFFIILLLSIIGEGLVAQTSVEVQSAILDTLLSNQNDNSYDFINRINMLDRQLELKDPIIRQLKFQIVQIDKDIDNNQQYYHNLLTQLEYEKKKYAELIVQADKIKNSMYQNFDIFSFDNLYKSFRQFLFIKYLSDYRAKKIKRIKDLKSEIGNVMEKLELEKTKRNNVALKLGVEESFVTKYSKSRLEAIKEFERQLADKPIEITSVKGDLYSPDTVSLSLSNAPQVSEQDALLFEVQKGYLEWPVKNSVLISSFGEKKHPVYEKITIRNDGINFLVPAYSVVNAVFDGVVSKVVTLPSNQFAIIVRHGSYFTVYSGLDHIKVSAGDEVHKNSEIGSYENNEGRLILNFQIWSGTQKLNPKLWLKQNSKK